MPRQSIFATFRILAPLLAAILLSVAVWAAPSSDPPVLEPDDRHAKISRLVTTLFERSHYSRPEVDDELSSRVLDRYIEALDSNRHYLTASDVESFERYRFKLDDAVKRGDLDPVFAIYRLYLERMRQRVDHALTLLDGEAPDFTEDERYVYDREELGWAPDQAALDEIWRLRVKNDALSLVMTGKTWDETRDLLRGRYERVGKRIEQVNSDDVFEQFMNAYSHTLDPHSNYFSPRNSEEYRIQMSLSYDGIGASLRLQDEYVQVLSIIPGGPAAVDGSLKPNDRITGVAQGPDGKMADVVGWRLDDVVDLIRGPGGTVVRLQVLRAGAAPGDATEVLALTRDKIKLEAQAAKSSRITIDRGDDEFVVGVVEVPSFYQDYNAKAAGESDYTSTTADVRRLVKELMDEGVDGLLIDLRNNGGGHLSEATALTGLFIDEGPVVQLRDTAGRVEVLNDPTPGDFVYDGPLAVLVNRYSASASEIFAGAIQDYGRGIVIGQQTYGKGTVQNLYPLDRYAPGRDPRFGQLTLTIGKYYRVSGESTQHRGVSPDIELASGVDVNLVGESTRDAALPWDQIDPTRYRATDLTTADLDGLMSAFESRSSEDPDYSWYLRDIEADRASRMNGSVSLNLETRKQEREAAEAESLARENERRAAQGLDSVESLADIDGDEMPDVALTHAAEIVADLTAVPDARMARNEGR